MARHEIKIDLPAAEVVNKDLRIRVKSDDSALGRLEISKGSVDWWPAGNSTNFYRVSWERLADLIEQNGRRVNKPT